MRRFAEILQSSESRLAAARGWLAQIWAMIISPRAFRQLLTSKPMQTQLRWKLRLTEALLRLAITQRANAIIPPPLTPTRPNLRRLPGGIFLPADPLGPPYVARFRLSAQPSRWAIQPPVSAPQTRQPQHPAALLHRLLACQDGLDRFEKLAWLEAKRKRRFGDGGGGTPKIASAPIRHATGGAPLMQRRSHHPAAPWPDPAGAGAGAPPTGNKPGSAPMFLFATSNPSQDRYHWRVRRWE
jgi:hypothetical protein